MRLFISIHMPTGAAAKGWISPQIYTTGIMTNKEFCDKIRYGLRKADQKTDSGKEMGMAALNRNYSLYSENCEASLDKQIRWDLISCAHIRLSRCGKYCFSEDPEGTGTGSE